MPSGADSDRRWFFYRGSSALLLLMPCPQAAAAEADLASAHEAVRTLQVDGVKWADTQRRRKRDLENLLG